MTRRIADFEPQNPPEVGMYSCGPTVYAPQHIGNMRAYVFADTLKRVLRWKGLRVRHVVNITDVGHLTSDADEGDDKLEVAARRERRDAWAIADHYATMFKRDLAGLGVLEPDVWCKATDHIPQMIRFAQALDDKGWCYILPSGLYFDTSKDPHYGELARLGREGQREGARVKPIEGKHSPSDFAVWRTSAPGENRQMEWDSPWGPGTPGWHLECSVMSMEYLGRHFDIHTGGVDHIPVHHTNEVAQSQAYLADDRPWVGWWLHGEFINLKGAKISKSTGGGVLLDDLIDRGYHPFVYRYLLLQAHYRSQVDFSWAAMDSARRGLRRLLDRYALASVGSPAKLTHRAWAHLDTFDQAISDDLNTSKALAVVEAAAQDDRISEGQLATLALEFDSVLAIGLCELDAGQLDIKPSGVSITEERIGRLLAERQAARAELDFTKSDRIRQQLADHGVMVHDQPDGESTWRWA